MRRAVHRHFQRLTHQAPSCTVCRGDPSWRSVGFASSAAAQRGRRHRGRSNRVALEEQDLPPSDDAANSAGSQVHFSSAQAGWASWPLPSSFGSHSPTGKTQQQVDDAGGTSDIMFEDIDPEQSFSWAAEEGPDVDASEVSFGLQPKVWQKKAAPVPDESLAQVNLLELRKDEVVWAVGRASVLKLGADARLWRDLPGAIAALGGEVELKPSELCRLLQALAYAPEAAPLDQPLLRRFLKVFALRAKEYSDERLMRVVYAYGKLAAKRGIRMSRFMDFATSEVIQRDKSLGGWRKVRILEAIGSLQDAGPEFRALVVSQVIQNDIKDLDADSFARFVPFVVEAEFHQRPNVMNALNSAYRRKLKHVNFDNPDKILMSGLPLLLHDMMKTSVLTKWLERLAALQVPLVSGAAPRAGDEQEQRRSKQDHLVAADALRAARNAEAKNELPEMPEMRRGKQDHLEPANALRAARNLEALKLAELCLRHERPAVLQSLPPRAVRLLNTARDTLLEPPENHHMPELPHVFAELRRLFRRSGLLLHPCVFGPYLLELSDPLGRTVVEWDSSWLLYPPWRRSRHEQYVRRKHLHLRAEGWKVLCVPLEEFRALSSKDEKISYLERFSRQHRLEHLCLHENGSSSGMVPDSGSADATAAAAE